MEELIYYVGEYFRLSRDKLTAGKDESNSITNQKEIVKSHIDHLSNMKVYNYYIDDGYTGANFDRPAFQRLLADIYAGRVNCVVVKDLSRFGRDYIEVGRFIQKIFPALGVRFIAVTDHYDSLTAEYNESALVLPVKNFVNDSYCRDISEKVKSQQRIKRANGQFIGSFAVYGYKKDSQNKNVLIPDEYAAQIVKKIFMWKIDGLSSAAIAEKLNGMSILSPLAYKQHNNLNFKTGFRVSNNAKWSAVAVIRILENEVYKGTLVQGKTEKISHKVKKYALKPIDDWVRVEGTHKPIISCEDFDNVQRLLSIDSRAAAGHEKAYIFTGFLFCGDCNTAMIRRVNRYRDKEKVYYICSTRNKGQGCTRHTIAEDELKEKLLAGLKMQIALFVNKAVVLNGIEGIENETVYGDVTSFDNEIIRLRKEQDQYVSLRSGLYEDLKFGIITQDDYIQFSQIYDQKCKILENSISKHESLTRNLFKSGLTTGIKLEQFKSILNLSDITRDVLVTFIDRILIYEDKRICIRLKNQELFNKVIMVADYIQERIIPPTLTSGMEVR